VLLTSADCGGGSSGGRGGGYGGDGEHIEYTSCDTFRFVFRPDVAYARTFPPQKDYWVTEKVDGVRMCLRITANAANESNRNRLITIQDHEDGNYNDGGAGDDYTGSGSCHNTCVDAINLDGELVETPLGLAFVICDIASCDKWDGIIDHGTDISVLLTERMTTITDILDCCSNSYYAEANMSTSCFFSYHLPCLHT
jgi:hypothetical protein